MKDSKLVSILTTLTKTELNQLEQLVYSPFFNKNKTVQLLFDTVAVAYPLFEEDQVERHFLYRQIFPGEEYSEQRLRYVMSDLTKLVEEFLIQKELEERPYIKQHYLIQSLHKRNQTNYTAPVLDAAKKGLTQYPYKNTAYYFYSFLVERDDYEVMSSKRNIAVVENLQSIIHNIDIYYIINKLRFSSELLNHTSVFAGKFEPLLLEEILGYLKNNKPYTEPAVAIYHKIILTLLEPEEENHYQRLKILLQENVANFPKDEINEMYIFARNYCSKKINAGEGSYLKELLDLYRDLLQNEIIYDNGYLTQWDYKNIVAVALRLEEYEWVEQFIYDYKDRIEPESRQNAFAYNLSLFYYHLKDYDKALELLQSVEFTDIFYQLDYRALLIKTFYEKEEFDPLYSLFDSFYVYLRRNKLLSEYHRSSYSNFLKFVKKILRLKLNPDKNVQPLKHQINAAKPVANATWLFKKLDEIEAAQRL